jgi:hypothetical protein
MDELRIGGAEFRLKLLTSIERLYCHEKLAARYFRASANHEMDFSRQSLLPGWAADATRQRLCHPDPSFGRGASSV